MKATIIIDCNERYQFDLLVYEYDNGFYDFDFVDDDDYEDQNERLYEFCEELQRDDDDPYNTLF